MLTGGGDRRELPDFEGAAAVRHGGRWVLSAMMGFRWTAVDGKRLAGSISARWT
jgi:hypothetical protein